MAEGIDNGSSNEERVALFRELFFGWQDVYARRFENAKSGRSLNDLKTIETDRCL